MGDAESITAATQAALTPSFIWGKGELISICFGVLFAVAGCGINHRSISVEKVAGHLSNGIAFGPLAMIVADPANKWGEWLPFDLFNVAMTEARVTLWWAAFMAATYVLRTVFR